MAGAVFYKGYQLFAGAFFAAQLFIHNAALHGYASRFATMMALGKEVRMPPIINDTNLWLKQAFPLPVVVTLVVYTMGASTYVSTWKSEMESRMKVLEKVAEAVVPHENRLVVLEQQFLRIRDDLAEIKTMLRDKKASLDGVPSLKSTPTISPASALPQ